MTTKIFWHPDIFLHDRFAQHPVMKAGRIESIFQAVSQLPELATEIVEPASQAVMALVHGAQYLDELFQHAPDAENIRYALDPETVMNNHTLRAIQLSVGAVISALDAKYSGRISNAFCPIYAGHHALPAFGMGFCFVNSIAIGARYAASLGYKRIAVADFDTHSGNGSIIALQNDPRFLFIETYQAGFPGKFVSSDHPPKNIFRICVHDRLGWRRAWQDDLFPALNDFQPEILLVSAGFDAHKHDPLGLIGLEDEDYLWISKALADIQPGIVSALEGGYSLPDTGRCAALHVLALAAKTSE